MKTCPACGERVKPPRMAEHLAEHAARAALPPLPVLNEEVYWRDRISQEILGQRLALEYEPRATHHRTLEGMEIASDLAKGTP